MTETTGAGRHVLLLGGAGYVGSVLAPRLLERGYRVRCLDLLIYGQHTAVLPFLSHPAYEFRYGDIACPASVDAALEGVSDVVILAGLVGDPITKKYPGPSEAINEKAVSRLLASLDGRSLERVVFVSTCSNYGVMPEHELANEEYALKPVSAYARAKVDRERELLAMAGEVDFSGSVLRFATAFGLSPRMRFDLTVSHFTEAMYSGEELVVFDADSWRPYCHVQDLATAVLQILEAPHELVDFEVFNVGSDENNCTKRMIVEKGLEHFPDACVHYREQGEDPRNYRVDFGKIRDRLGFEPRYSVDDGVRELVGVLRERVFDGIDRNRSFYGNYEIDYDGT